jgi:hypothetical protein
VWTTLCPQPILCATLCGLPFSPHSATVSFDIVVSIGYARAVRGRCNRVRLVIKSKQSLMTGNLHVQAAGASHLHFLFFNCFSVSTRLFHASRHFSKFNYSATSKNPRAPYETQLVLVMKFTTSATVLAAFLISTVSTLPVKRDVDPNLVPDTGFSKGLNPTGSA